MPYYVNTIIYVLHIVFALIAFNSAVADDIEILGEDCLERVLEETRVIQYDVLEFKTGFRSFQPYVIDHDGSTYTYHAYREDIILVIQGTTTLGLQKTVKYHCYYKTVERLSEYLSQLEQSNQQADSAIREANRINDTYSFYLGLRESTY